MHNKNRITPSLEDYLETIYFLNNKTDKVRVTDVATALLISKPSVNKAINNLKAQGFVEHEHYGSLSLTSKGFLIAESIANCHIIIKKFLIDVLNVDETTAEKEACLMEHAMSLDTVSKLNELLVRLNNESN
jgi:DtxR family transcriptional regulator, Mn-dependent transcriptional regulator